MICYLRVALCGRVEIEMGEAAHMQINLSLLDGGYVQACSSVQSPKSDSCSNLLEDIG